MYYFVGSMHSSVNLFCPLSFLLAVFTVFFMGAAKLLVHMLFTVAYNMLIPSDTVGNWLCL